MPLLKDNLPPDERELQLKWFELRKQIKNQFGKRPDINGMLFLIGMNEVGQMKEEWEKEEKQDLMHVGLCSIMELEGYYERTHVDDDGWPHFKSLKSMPDILLKEQESLLKTSIIKYFIHHGLLSQ